MPKLNQIIAVEKGVKTRAERALTDVHQLLNKTDLLSGISRSYQSRDDEGDQLPAEEKLVQVRAHRQIELAKKALAEHFDVTFTKDAANCNATGDVVVDDKVLLTDVPVTYLLFLEKQLVNIKTFVNKLPVLDLGSEWEFDDNVDAYATKPYETTRTQKTHQNHVLAEATEHHPAQVDVVTVDVIVGTWRNVRYSGAVSSATRAKLVQRVNKLIDAVKVAREQANLTETEKKDAKAILDYIFD